MDVARKNKEAISDLCFVATLNNVVFLLPDNSCMFPQAITTIGPPECCTEACYQIMKIMQNELLMTNGMMESG